MTIILTKRNIEKHTSYSDLKIVSFTGALALRKPRKRIHFDGENSKLKVGILAEGHVLLSHFNFQDGSVRIDYPTCQKGKIDLLKFVQIITSQVNFLLGSHFQVIYCATADQEQVNTLKQLGFVDNSVVGDYEYNLHDINSKVALKQFREKIVEEHKNKGKK